MNCFRIRRSLKERTRIISLTDMKILIAYYPDLQAEDDVVISDNVLYKASAGTWEDAEMQLETLRKVVAKDKEAEAKLDDTII